MVQNASATVMGGMKVGTFGCNLLLVTFTVWKIVFMFVRCTRIWEQVWNIAFGGEWALVYAIQRKRV